MKERRANEQDLTTQQIEEMDSLFAVLEQDINAMQELAVEEEERNRLEAVLDQEDQLHENAAQVHTVFLSPS